MNQDNHCLFEEIPSLGVAGDMLMAVATDAQEPEPVFGFAFPDRAAASENLLGKFYPIGTRRAEIAQRLAGYGIAGNAFSEYCSRFNRQYFRSISDILVTWTTFRLDKVSFVALTYDGSTVQIVVSEPSNDQGQHGWLKRDVQNTSPEEETTAVMGAAFAFRFQLRKEPIPGRASRLAQNANWCCVKSRNAEEPFQLPEGMGGQQERTSSLAELFG